MPERRMLQLPEARISYLEQGSPQSGRLTMVLIHGLMGTAATFASFMAALPHERHVIAIDLPGAGQSDRDPRVNPSLASLSHNVRNLLDRLELPAPLLVGHSHGGTVALHLSAAAPERVSGLVLMAPAHPFSRHADQLIAFYLSPVGRAFAYTMPWYPRWVQMAGLRSMAGPQSWDGPERLVPYRDNLRTRGTIALLLRLLRTWHDDMDELRDLLALTLRVPTLLLWGDHDHAVPVGTAAMLRRHLPEAELRVLAGVGHRPAEERPEICAQLIADWESRVSRVRDAPISAAG